MTSNILSLEYQGSFNSQSVVAPGANEINFYDFD